MVHGESGLGELVEDYLSRPLRLYVYNHEYAVTRTVTITPSRNWGGSGALGCVLGFGALHHLPPPLNEPPAAPGDTLFETAPFNNDTSMNPSSEVSVSSAARPALANPANVSAPPAFAVSAVPPRASRKQRQGISPNRAFDEYFQESEKRSKEDDYIPATRSASNVPPPPKTGGMMTSMTSPTASATSRHLEVHTHLPIPPLSGGEPRQTRSPDPILDDEGEELDDDGDGEGVLGREVMS